ncbi:PQQ-dependent sugar dehydrogenase [Oceanicoccus sagamiensis]|uniref:Cytochrome c domain-containing protein n=1 Tax=Oceanicoccus sagamiensis TaxID=716816 RepID=A0A1X9NEK8_9GAMM|nr:PQQ-dependent sugar dehydrogenase [Oceanicoccus sagamiensis]ARN74325.1 hypothetical protein BST96_09425 [Oceanicoccus sagamiensis]
MAGFSLLFNENCAVCHGENLKGAAQGPALIGKPLINGDDMDSLVASISKGNSAKGMPAWSGILSKLQINNLALYIAERRSGLTYTDFNIDNTLLINQDPIQTQHHTIKLQTVITDLDPLPFSIEPLPDGRILLTEKMRGLSIISKDGKQSALIKGTPKVYSDTGTPDVGLLNGLGWLLDVAIHPDYLNNGWVYLHYGDRCSDCNKVSRENKLPVSMNKIVRGRINNGQWIDQQVIWQASLEHYGMIPDTAAGGRLSFDQQGHLFFSVGLKGNDNHTGVQDLTTPWGKIHRVNDDGSIPEDNPFTKSPKALKSIWAYGFRSPQGLEFNTRTNELWVTDMGPRGGDEVNLIFPGKNYGWPLYSKGVNYDSTPVEYGKKLGIDFKMADIEQPIVDLTPSPAVSSFIIYQDKHFPKWNNHLIVGSLKARKLYRMKIEDGVLIENEVLIENLARIRDIEIANSGEILLLLEHGSGGQILKITSTSY